MAEPYADIETFRTRYRLNLLERLSLLTFFQTWTSAGLTSDQCQELLAAWLEGDVEVADQRFGPHLGDAALTALHTEEMRDIHANLKKAFAKIADEGKRNGL